MSNDSVELLEYLLELKETDPTQACKEAVIAIEKSIASGESTESLMNFIDATLFDGLTVYAPISIDLNNNHASGNFSNNWLFVFIDKADIVGTPFEECCYPYSFPFVVRFVEKLPCEGIQLYVEGAERALGFTKEDLRETRKKMDIALPPDDSELGDLIETLRKSKNGPAIFKFLISKEFVNLIKLTVDDPRKACARAIPMSLEDRFDYEQKSLIRVLMDICLFRGLTIYVPAETNLEHCHLMDDGWIPAFIDMDSSIGTECEGKCIEYTIFEVIEAMGKQSLPGLRLFSSGEAIGYRLDDLQEALERYRKIDSDH